MDWALLPLSTRDNYYNVLGGGGCNSYLNYVVPGLVAVLWLTTTLSCHMDVGGVCFRKPPYTLPLLREWSRRSTARSLV